MAKKITFYQKPRCKTCDRARDWFEEQDGVDVLERDITLTPPPLDLLARHVEGEGDDLRGYLNPRSGPYRRKGLSKSLPSRDRLLALMAEEPDLIRRPLVIRGRRAVFGHDEGAFRELLDG